MRPHPPFLEIPIEWHTYVTQSNYGLEVLPATLYDTQLYHSEFTLSLEFFRNCAKGRPWTNMEMNGFLPNSKSFLIESIRIHGITNRIQFGAGVLNIGNKHWGYNPAWTYGLKEKGYRCSPPLMIAPLQNFEFRLHWEKPEELGPGLSGMERRVMPIQVVFFGKMARAIQ